MLIPGLYEVKHSEAVSAGKYSVTIRINPDHDIFKGHFPGNPVMPGVCMIQIIKELAAHLTHSALQLSSMSNVKFMALINPEVNPELNLDLEITETPEGFVKVKNTTYFEETAALKFSGSFKKPSL